MDDTKKKPFWVLTLLIPVAFFALLEVVLRFAGYGSETDFASVQEFNGKKYYVINRLLARRYFPHQSMLAPGVYDCTFEYVKSPATYRIFCLGESTMQGYPYEYNGAVHRMLADRLMSIFPNRKIEIVNLGITAANSYSVLDLVKEVVKYQPDLVIIYVGHNEFYGSLGVASQEYLGRKRAFIKAYLALDRWRVFQLIRHTIDDVISLFRKDAAAIPSATFFELAAREKSIPFHSELYFDAKDIFEANLSEVVGIASSRGVPVMLSTVVSNLLDWPPFIAQFSPSTGEEQRARWFAFVHQADAMRGRNQFKDALQNYTSAALIDSARADLQYDLGVCLAELGRTAEAKQHFARARDFDQLRFRATDEFNEVIRTVAREKHIMLADMVHLFEQNSKDSLVGYSLILEHVHPNLDGYFLMSKEYARIMQENDCIRPKAEWRPALPDELYKSQSLMTVFDFETSFLRIDILMHHWPFKEPDSTRYIPTTDEGRLALKYLREEVTWEQAHYQLAELYNKEQRYEDAAREYLAIAKVLGFDYRPLMLAGDVNINMNHKIAAEGFYRRALALSANKFVYERLGTLFNEGGEADSAVIFYRCALKADADAGGNGGNKWKLDVMQRLAEAYAACGDSSNASREAMSLLAIDPANRPAEKILSGLRLK